MTVEKATVDKMTIENDYRQMTVDKIYIVIMTADKIATNKKITQTDLRQN